MHLNLFLQWLAANIDASNAIRVWLAADKLSLLNLKDVCFDYILAHKQEVLRRVDLGQLPVDVLNTILAHREVQDQVVSLNTHKPNELSLNLSHCHHMQIFSFGGDSGDEHSSFHSSICTFNLDDR